MDTSVEPSPEGAAEPAPVDNRDYEGLFTRWSRLHHRAHHGRTLIRASEVPMIESRQGKSQFYLMPQFEELALTQWVVFVRHMTDAPGGRHRHQGGIALFVLHGRGFSVIDSRRLDWAAGDVVYLPLVPGGLDHQHYPAEGEALASFMGIIYEPLIVAVGAEMTQLTPYGPDAPSGGLVDGAAEAGYGADAPGLSPPPTLDGLLRLADHERRTLAPPPFIRGASLPVDRTAFGALRWYLHPAAPGFGGTAPMLLFTSEIGPGEHTWVLTCPGNGFLHVLRGAATVHLDDEAHDCGAGDMVCLPPRREGIRLSLRSGPGVGAQVLVAMANLSGLAGLALGSEFALRPGEGGR